MAFLRPLLCVNVLLYWQFEDSFTLDNFFNVTLFQNHFKLFKAVLPPFALAAVSATPCCALPPGHPGAGQWTYNW